MGDAGVEGGADEEGVGVGGGGEGVADAERGGCHFASCLFVVQIGGGGLKFAGELLIARRGSLSVGFKLGLKLLT